MPIGAFYVVGGALLLLLHTYVMLHMVLVSSNLQSFINELDLTPTASTPVQLRMLFPFELIPVIVPGAHLVVVRGAALFFIFVSICIAPLAVLLVAQVRCLPVHDPSISSAQRVLVKSSFQPSHSDACEHRRNDVIEVRA